MLQELMVRSRAEAAPPKLEELTVEELMRRYAADRGRALKETTLEDYWSCVRVQLAPQFRTRPVADLKSADVEDLITRLTAARRAPKTVRNYVTILSTLLNYAVRRECAADRQVRAQ